MKPNNKLKELFKSHHIILALAVGISIILMAYFSKRILDKPISYLLQGVPPFIAIIYEIVLNRKVNSKLTNPYYWAVAIIVTTLIIIAIQFL